MRRKEKEISDRPEMEQIISRSRVCRLAMADESGPYVVPLCFGYAPKTLYFHSAREGRKIDILRKRDRVCFEFDIDPEVVARGRKGCEWGMAYRSVIGFGKAVFVEDRSAKRTALDIIMRQYGDGPFELSDEKIDKTLVIRVDIEQMTGKRSA